MAVNQALPGGNHVTPPREYHNPGNSRKGAAARRAALDFDLRAGYVGKEEKAIQTGEESRMSKSYRSELVGVFGYPVDENPTGVVEEAAFREAGIPWRYLTVLVKPEDLGDAVRGMRAMNWRGVNLTIPHKIAVISHLDELSPAAEIIGAVNTVVNREGRLLGENTDGKGMLKSLVESGRDPKGRHVTVLGAGGAARAVAVECALAGARKVSIINRTVLRGEELAALVSGKTAAACEFLPWTPGIRVPEGTDLLINATSIGLFPDTDARPDIDYGSVGPSMAAADVVFNPPDTPFLKEVAARGAQAINGLGMLVNQAAVNFNLWTGLKAPEALMMEALKGEFGLA